MIYLDHNATTPLHPAALEALLTVLRDHWGNPSSPHRLGHQARQVLEQARARLAELLGCAPGELLLCGSGTEADNLVLRGVTDALRERGRHIVTTAIEHHAVLHTCDALERDGVEVTRVAVDGRGVIDLEQLERSLRDDTVLVSVMHANNETGVVQPLEQVAALCRARGVLLHTDAVQSAGKLPVRLGELGADLVTVSSHKLYGPRGAAALLVREGTPLSSTTTGGAQERRLRAGTEDVAAIAGFAEAAAQTLGGAVAEAERLSRLRDHLEERVRSAISGVTINGEGAPRVPNTTNLSFDDVDGESIVFGLDLHGICASTGSACSTADAAPSHVLLAMGRSARAARGSVRLSLGHATTAEDIETTARVLADTVGRLRGISSL